MNSEYLINSIYNPKRKQKQALFFPKISKVESPLQPDSKIFVRSIGKKYNQVNIFKREEARQKPLLQIRREGDKGEKERQRQRERQKKELEEIEEKIAQMTRIHQEDLQQMQDRQIKIGREMEQSKKQQYQLKLALWELKNEVMELTNIHAQQDAQYQRLYEELGYDEEEQDIEQQILQKSDQENDDGQDDNQQHSLSNQEEVSDRASLPFNQIKLLEENQQS